MTVLIIFTVVSIVFNIFLLLRIVRYRSGIFSQENDNQLLRKTIGKLEEEIKTNTEKTICLKNRWANLSAFIAHVSSKELIGTHSFYEEALKAILKIYPEADYGYIAKIERDDWAFLVAAGYDLEQLKRYSYRREFFGFFPEPVHIIKPESIALTKLPPYLINTVLSASPPIETSIVVDLEIGDQVIGHLRIDTKKGKEESFSEDVIAGFKDFSRILSALMTVQKYFIMQEKFQRDIVFSIVKILEIYDAYTKGHSEHVAELAGKLGKAIGLSEENLQVLYWAGLVHDIGKILVPTSILNKPGKLTLQEYEMVKMHPVWGYQVLSTSEELQEIAFIVKHHHEHWNGKGYPENLSGTAIPLLSRIIAVVDTYDSMTSDRAYRTGLPKEEAFTQIRRVSGTQLDPHLTDVFLALFSEG
jgi:putative nucleotidyltransferase with HDIG domain